MSELRLVLGDQLNLKHHWFDAVDDSVTYLLVESVNELSYVPHHWQKAVAFLAAMRAFAAELSSRGHRVVYRRLDDADTQESLVATVQSLLETRDFDAFSYQRPDEYRLSHEFETFEFSVSAQCIDSEHFILPFEEISSRFKAGTAHRMEAFYRFMRKRTGYLMEADEPEGGRWNYDAENRKPIGANDDRPKLLLFSNDVEDIVQLLTAKGLKFFGQKTTQLLWPIDRRQSLALLRAFCIDLLPRFGDYQDAMSDQNEVDWSLYHSRLSFSLNSKMISPREVIEAAIRTRDENPELISISQLEGFVRQILGWREFVRGMYWANMPDYPKKNELQHEAKLPEFFWSGNTHMRCVNKSVEQTIEYGYAHHIQRLMVLGNIANLLGVNPYLVHEWFLSVYVDAIEWVEAPNVIGMALSADGGLIASKPYVSSGNYINKMSNYCKGCRYKPTIKTGEGACPFNSLYWDFLDRHRDRYGRNNRLAFAYKNLDRKPPSEMEAIRSYADTLKRNANEL